MTNKKLSIMKKYILFFLTFLYFGQINSQSTELIYQPACGIATLEEISTTIGIDTSLLVQKSLNFRNKTSRCYVFDSNDVQFFVIRLEWKSQGDILKQVLLTNYQTYLSQGDKYISNYQELSSPSGTQTLFGTGQNDENRYVHIIRRRYGDEAEALIEMTLDALDSNAQSKLQTILNSI